LKDSRARTIEKRDGNQDFSQLLGEDYLTVQPPGIKMGADETPVGYTLSKWNPYVVVLMKSRLMVQ
jgi:hypothetical protein